MDEDNLNIEIRKFLKKVGITSQREIENYIRKKIIEDNLIEELLDLESKNLGCWCAPNRCHGDVLVKLIEEFKNYNLLVCS